MPAVLERKQRNVEELTCDAYNDDPTRVRRVARQMPSDDAFDCIGVLLKAMADPILYALTMESLCVCELASLLEMSMPAVSHHLKILTTSGLLKIRKEGKFACYYLRDEHLHGTLNALITDLEQFER